MISKSTDPSTGINTTTLSIGKRKITSQWTLEAAEDLKALQGVDLEQELIKMMGQEMNRERKYGEIMRRRDFEFE